VKQKQFGRRQQREGSKRFLLPPPFAYYDCITPCDVYENITSPPKLILPYDFNKETSIFRADIVYSVIYIYILE